MTIMKMNAERRGERERERFHKDISKLISCKIYKRLAVDRLNVATAMSVN